jgi:hypothetical protein
LEEQTTTISIARRLGSAWTVYGAAGAILGGQIQDPSGRYDVGAGWMLSLGGSRLIFPQQGWRPFLSSALSLSASRTDTTAPDGGATSSLWAIDLRGSVAAGWTFFERATVYGAFRAFGGPVFWDRVSQPGGDQYHVQGAVGVGVGIVRDVRLFVEGAPLGQRGIQAGFGFAFGRPPAPISPVIASNSGG